MDELDKQLDNLKPLDDKPLSCPNCDSDMEESRAFGVKFASGVVIFLPVLLVVLDFSAKANHIDWSVDEKILASCLAGIALVLAFGFRQKSKG